MNNQDRLSAFDRWLDAEVSGTPESPQAEGLTQFDRIELEAQDAARQFHGLARRADSAHAIPVNRLSQQWEDLMVTSAINPGSDRKSSGWSRPLSALPAGWRVHRPRGQRLTLLVNGAVAAMIVLALAAGIWRYTGGLNGGGDGSEHRQLAALNAQDGSPEASPMAGPADTSHLVMAQSRKLTAADCTVQPRTRDELIELLTTRFGEWQGTKSLDYPAVRDQYIHGSKKNITQADYDQLQAGVDQWRACNAFGTFWQWAAVTSDYAFLRELYAAYPGGYLVQIDTPYSAETVAEIVDKWEESFRPSDILSEGGSFDSVDSISVDPSTLQWMGQEYMIAVDCQLEAPHIGGPIIYSTRFFFEDAMWRIGTFMYPMPGPQ